MPEQRLENESSKKIAAGMTDDERYALLKDRNITVVGYDRDRLNQIDGDDYAALERISTGDALKILRRVGEEFGMFKDGYTAKDVDFTFAFTKSSLRESVNKQHGQFQNYAKMMTVFEDVINSAVGIETHKERYASPGSNLELIFVFISAFNNGVSVVPVLMEVKTYTDDTQATLYIAVSLQEIERSRISAYTQDTESVKSYTSPTSINISLAELAEKVNVLDKNLIKYLPDGFLGDTQKEAKKTALQETAEYVARKNAQRAEKVSFAKIAAAAKAETARRNADAARSGINNQSGKEEPE